MTEAKLMHPGLSGSSPQEKRIIRIALLLSVLLHVLLVLILRGVEYAPDPDLLARADRDREIELLLEPAPEDQDVPESEQPTAYTSVPERQAVPEAPEDPEYLALHHSLAADNKLGDGDRPSADEEGEVEQVAIRQEEVTGAGGVEYTEQPVPEREAATTRQQSGADAADADEAAGEDQTPTGAWALPEQQERSGGETEGTGRDEATEDKPELEEWWGGPQNPSILKEGDQGSVGDRGFDFNQRATGSSTSGVAMVDDFQLSTVQWDWAPWVQHFANELHRHWVSPYAYRLGLIHGTTVIRLVVEKDGRPSSMAILEQDGHQSLHDASLAALKAFAPYLPLPAHFPEENLVITLSLHYPAFRR